MPRPYLLSISADAKTVKGEKFGFLTGILYLSPSDSSGAGNVCPHASPGCRAACLVHAGRGRFKWVIEGRKRKTKLWFENRAEFLKQLERDIQILLWAAEDKKLKPVIRLNGTSDIPWENYIDFDKYPQIQFMDYTKDFARYKRVFNKYKNYSLTFSRSEINAAKVEKVLQMNGNVSVLFENRPEQWNGRKVINGDLHDLRFTDKPGSIVALSPKGWRAKQDRSGFVVRSQ